MKRKIVVLGGGISGYGSAILAKKKGFDVFLSDMGKIAPKFRERLDEWKLRRCSSGLRSAWPVVR